MPIDGLQYEMQIRSRGRVPAGLDEAGRGPIAGPVVAAAAVLPEDFDISGVDDSKKLSSAQRAGLFEQFNHVGVKYAVGIARPREIDKINILQATARAMERAVDGLEVTVDFLFLDGTGMIKSPIEQQTLVGGDGKCMSIAVASIIAKVIRDGIMEDLHIEYPAYSFHRHKGYPTAAHKKAIEIYGPCPEHRKSFRLTG